VYTNFNPRVCGSGVPWIHFHQQRCWIRLESKPRIKRKRKKAPTGGVQTFFSVADPNPGFGVFLTQWIRNPGWVKKSRSGSGMNIPDHISESLETIFWIKILKFFDADPDSGSGTFLTLDPGSGINIPDPQHQIF
jgi:hypothetical protein